MCGRPLLSSTVLVATLYSSSVSFSSVLVRGDGLLALLSSVPNRYNGTAIVDRHTVEVEMSLPQKIPSFSSSASERMTVCLSVNLRRVEVVKQLTD
jgi:hypothetical protein